MELRVFDPMGRLVRTLLDENLSAGRNLVTWDGKDAQGHLVPNERVSGATHDGGLQGRHQAGVPEELIRTGAEKRCRTGRQTSTMRGSRSPPSAWIASDRRRGRHHLGVPP